MLKVIMKLMTRENIITVTLLLILVTYAYKLATREDFQVIDLVVPPLEQKSCEEYAYGCKVNAYKCEPFTIYQCVLQGIGEHSDVYYLKYKMIDEENVVHYTGLYNNLDGLRVGMYVIFDNGQEYVITSLDMESQPEDCPTVRHRSLKQ